MDDLPLRGLCLGDNLVEFACTALVQWVSPGVKVRHAHSSRWQGRLDLLLWCGNVQGKAVLYMQLIAWWLGMGGSMKRLANADTLQVTT